MESDFIEDNNPDHVIKRDHYVLLIHGIRTQAEHQTQIKVALESDPKLNVIPVGYEYLDIFHFLAFGRKRPVDKIASYIRGCNTNSPKPEKISVIAHSFGTYIVAEILKSKIHHDIKFNTIILCGSIVSRSYDWFAPHYKYKGRVINECGILDVWPILASFVTIGYGPTGRLGFQSPRVKDRFHNLGHSGFLNEDFAKKYWLPVLRGDDSIEGEVNRPKTPYFISILSTLSFSKFVVLVVALGLLLFYLPKNISLPMTQPAKDSAQFAILNGMEWEVLNPGNNSVVRISKGMVTDSHYESFRNNWRNNVANCKTQSGSAKNSKTTLTKVTGHCAVEFAKWVGEATGKKVRLPTLKELADADEMDLIEFSNKLDGELTSDCKSPGRTKSCRDHRIFDVVGGKNSAQTLDSTVGSDTIGFRLIISD